NGRKIYFEKGPALLNGEEALAFVRMRKRPINVTYTRMERQRQFLKAALTQAISAGTLFKVDDIGDILGEHVETSLTPKQIYTLEKGYAKLDKIHTLEIEGEDKRIPAETGPYYFIPDPDSLEQVRDQLRKSLGLPAESEDFESSEVSTEE
ncbi:MAG TPA: LCP family protein, partial [Bacillales bacterium]|nr:LCP family protein [Bacillales bacterium]